MTNPSNLPSSFVDVRLLALSAASLAMARIYRRETKWIPYHEADQSRDTTAPNVASHER